MIYMKTARICLGLVLSLLGLLIEVVICLLSNINTAIKKTLLEL